MLLCSYGDRETPLPYALTFAARLGTFNDCTYIQLQRRRSLPCLFFFFDYILFQHSRSSSPCTPLRVIYIKIRPLCLVSLPVSNHFRMFIVVWDGTIFLMKITKLLISFFFGRKFSFQASPTIPTTLAIFVEYYKLYVSILDINGKYYFFALNIPKTWKLWRCRSVSEFPKQTSKLEGPRKEDVLLLMCFGRHTW